MDDGFWLYLVALFAAAGPLSHTMNLTAPGRLTLLGAIALSIGAALFTMMMGSLEERGAREAMRWLSFFLLMGSLTATGVCVGFLRKPPATMG